MLGTNQLTNIGKYQKSAEMSLTTLNSWKVLCSLQTKHSFCVCVLVVPWSRHWFCIVKPHPGLISKVLSQKSVTLQYGFYIIRNDSRWHMNKLKFFHPNASFREKKALKKFFFLRNPLHMDANEYCCEKVGERWQETEICSSDLILQRQKRGPCWRCPYHHLTKEQKSESLVETTRSSTCIANTLTQHWPFKQTDTLTCIISTGLLRESF